jgi:hypothetical protein
MGGYVVFRFTRLFRAFGLILMPRIGVSLAGFLATHKLGRREVEELLDTLDLLGYELARAVSLLG